MRLLFIAIASSVLLAAIVTGINLRFLADAPIVAFIVTTVAMFIVAVVNARTALRTYTNATGAGTAAKAPAAKGSTGGNRGKQDAKDNTGSGNRSRRGGRGSGRDDAGKGNNAGRQDAPRGEAPRKDAAKAAPIGDAPAHEGTPVTGEYETGEVKWFSRSKGFGFIVRPNGEEIFVHHRSVRAEGERRPSLRDGEPVRYIVTDHDKGLQAEDVTAA